MLELKLILSVAGARKFFQNLLAKYAQNKSLFIAAEIA
jgi:hypothetical protein